MKLTIFGASGATGTSLVQQALAAGHSVTAVVRDPGRLAVPAHQRLEVVTADVLDPADISPAVDSAGAVISAVGPGTDASTLRQDSTRTIIAAMQKTGTRRLLIISGSIVADDGESAFMRYLLKPVVRRTFLRHACADMRRAEDEVHDSNLDWTILRPPSLTNKTATGTYRTAIDRNLHRGFSISRADLAAYMLTLLDDPAAKGRHIAIAN
jgi:putative NADH-flavin reductase